MPALPIVLSKTLKLTNVLIATMGAEDFTNLDKFAYQMENYIKSKGFQPIGPLVQYINVQPSENGEPELAVRMLRQANGFINHTEPPYTMESVLRIPSCLYLRFIGPQDKLNIAYSKLTVYAYEEDIPLTGNNYTVFVNQLENEDIVADVFMEKAHE